MDLEGEDPVSKAMPIDRENPYVRLGTTRWGDGCHLYIKMLLVITPRHVQ